MRKLTFKCPNCPDVADGAHQCGSCFRHVHGFCGEPWPGSEEGYGQMRRCKDCVAPDPEVKESDTSGLDDQEQDSAPGEHGPVSQDDFEDLRKKGLDYFNFHMDLHGRDELTPDDDDFNLFTRLNALEHGPNMDLNEFYALLSIFEGAQKTVMPPPTRPKGSKGKRKWAAKLLADLQLEPKSEDGLPKKPRTKKKKKVSCAALEEDVGNLMSLDPTLEEGGVHVPDASKKKKKKKKKRSAVDAAPCDASKETVDGATGIDGTRKKKKKKVIS